MSLEEKFQQKRIVRRYPSAEVLAQAEKGNKFIVVQDDFDPNYVPQGYTLIDMKHKGNSFKTLVPQSLLFYMANPNEGDSENALDEIADFYDEAEDFEDEMIEEGKTNVQEANWATLSRRSYHVYLINKLVKSKDGERDEDEEPIPEFNPDVLKQLDLDDPYVVGRIKGIVAVVLGKNAEAVKEYGIKNLLKHVSVSMDPIQITEKIGWDEFRRITEMRYKSMWSRNTKTMRCLADSHYYLLPEYEKDPVWDYNLRTMTKTRNVDNTIESEVFDAKVAELEKEINDHREKKHGNLGRHDKDLIREYINLAYIAKENPKAQLDITPPEKEKK